LKGTHGVEEEESGLLSKKEKGDGWVIIEEEVL
jgi:hypothetical protein